MVFESLVADLVNRFLGDFIENLDKSQLSIGIWGGDVQLNNLYVKENLFDDLDLPIRVVYGNIGQLKLKIPWKNLYTEPTIALLDGLYIIAVPNSSIAYDEAKEQKAMWEAKQKELNKIEEAKKIEAEKYQPKDPKKDTFAEKLTANVIKNLEVKVTNIHVRYEDAFTNPKYPFSIGVTLKEVSCQTTDENWNVMTIKENASTIHKLLKLDSFSLYWNLVPTSYRNQDRSNIMTTLKNNIAVTTTNNNNSINNNSYDINSIVEPLTSIAKLKMNPKPEQDGFQLPKIIFSVVFEEICIALQKMQYQTMLEYLDSFERLTLSSKYRKYRPIVPRRNNAKIWWKFAMDCVMNELVRRRRRMWSWQVLKGHRSVGCLSSFFYLCLFVLSFVCSFVCSFVPLFAHICSFVHLFIRLYIYFIDSFINSFFHSFILIPSFIRSFVCSFIHRELCRQYKKLYKQKLSTNKPSAELLKEIEVP
ncbi:hypothetical protein HELRODRAFT_72498 [Helobdella robusta]|uniref:Chorein N-terminal domain-containing protein n=1 Tax=Helobdella robusta TaxID=6412 RepID=T1G108_HELRO|nr:hypothetical protein HELRODRAFT_72498 [Helobdella robusta]ESO10807.1 hypothetical protein HELRODRAFT_72498 [Helobdella robusta]